MKKAVDKDDVSSVRYLIERLSLQDANYLSNYAIKHVISSVSASSTSLSDAIKNLLKPFAQQETNYLPAQMEFYLTLGDNPPVELVPSPSANKLLDLDVLRCFEENNMRYVEAPSVGWGVADLCERKAVIVALNKPILDVWSIAHLLFYPLWVQLLKTENIFALHAAGAVKDDVNLLFPAMSGVGKSILSLNLAKAGYRLLGDDTVFLCEENGCAVAVGYPEKVNLRPEGAALFSELPVNGPTEGSSWKASVDIEPIFPGCFLDEATPNALVFIERCDTSGSKVVAITKADALTRLFKYSLFFVDKFAGKEHFELLSKLVGQSRSYSLTIGTDREALLLAVDGIVSDVRRWR